MRREGFTPQGRQTEEQFFLEREKQLIDQLKKKAAAEAARKDLAQAVGVSDEGILNALEELGYNRDIVVVLHLFPLVAVAWADGEISDQERERIIEASKVWGIEPDTPAHARLLEWLKNKPAQAYSQRVLRIIRDILHFRPSERQDNYRSRIADLCEQVAEASGGFLGLGSKISAAEKAVLKKVTEELTSAHPAAVAKLLDEK